MHPFGLLLTSFLSLTNAASIQSRQTTACNNSPALCSKSYSAITHFGAHDSPFVRDASTGYSISGNQYYNSTVQLSAGVRLLSAQVHKNNGDWHLCHSSCDLLDAGLLSDWLKDIKEWMEANPNDVITILLVNSDNATPLEIHGEFTEAKITDLAYKPVSTTTRPVQWPTLQTLISAGTRLMVFVGSLPTASTTVEQSYLMDEFTFVFENNYENTKFSDFSCIPDRPREVKGNTEQAISSNRLALMNHFLYEVGALDIQTPDVDNITTTNSPSTTAVGMLGASLGTCQQAYGKAPTFVLVDFFDEGPAINAVDAINGITPTGRIALPARDTDTNRADSGFVGVKNLAEQVQEGKKPLKGAWIYAAGQWSFGGINLSGGDLVTK
ncbi:hypothetical protein LTS08_003757 [Lithohypha guttulata]|nr:hypothetical protein LTS08_003757 [Lithohypha guttulata]